MCRLQPDLDDRLQSRCGARRRRVHHHRLAAGIELDRRGESVPGSGQGTSQWILQGILEGGLGGGSGHGFKHGPAFGLKAAKAVLEINAPEEELSLKRWLDT